MRKITVPIFAALLFCFGLQANPTNTAPTEPTYEGKPVSYWMDMLSHSYDRAHLPILELIQTLPPSDERRAPAAMRAMGFAATPFVLKWDWNRTIRPSAETGPPVVIKAFQSFGPKDKRRLRNAPWAIWIHDPDRQVRASAVLAAPSWELIRADVIDGLSVIRANSVKAGLGYWQLNRAFRFRDGQHKCPW